MKLFGWLCHFMQHNWTHVMDNTWQCTRCGELSQGRNPKPRHR